MMQPFLKIFIIPKLKKFIGIALIFSAAFSFQAFSKDLRTDTTGTGNTAIVTDSSKIFSNLLSGSSSSSVNALNYSMNAEAKLFTDNYIKTHQSYFNNMKVWGKPYFALYDNILASHGIPVQLKYLSVIESSLSANAVSWAGAVGPWQIMSGVAKQHGLKTGFYDERVDYVKSTNAACRILKDLYNTYGDWLLVVAAYNAGSGNVNRAIAKAHTKDFWKLQYYLPEETRNHVKKFIATHYFFEGDGNTPPQEMAGKDPYLSVASTSTTINLYGKYNSVVIANTLMMDLSIFNKLNPDFDNVLAKGEVYPLRIPTDKVQLFQSKKMDILKQSVEVLLSGSASTMATGR